MKYFLILALLFSSCITQQKCFDKYPPSRDTTYIERVKEVCVTVPGDTVNLIVPVKCPDQDVAVMENSKLKQVIRILNGKLSSVTEIKPDTVKVSVIQTKEVIKEVSKPIKYIPTLYRFSLYFLIGIVFAILAFIAWKIFKPKF